MTEKTRWWKEDDRWVCGRCGGSVLHDWLSDHEEDYWCMRCWANLLADEVRPMERPRTDEIPPGTTWAKWYLAKHARKTLHKRKEEKK